MVNRLTHEILFSPSSSWWFPPSSLISLFLVLKSTIIQEHKVQSSLCISPCHDQELTPSTAYTVYSIHQAQHTLRKAYTAYCIHRILHHPRIDCLLFPASLSSLGRPCCTQFSTFPQWRVNQWIESQLPSCLPPKQPPSDWPPQSTPPIPLDHGPPVHRYTCSIIVSKYISKFLQLWPPSSFDHSLQVYL